VGAYVPGSSPEVDASIEAKAAIDNFLCQAPDERTLYPEAQEWMIGLHDDIKRFEQGAVA
jgi:flagellar biosynthesis/type III secretory pathway ATPase